MSRYVIQFEYDEYDTDKWPVIIDAIHAFAQTTGADHWSVELVAAEKHTR